MNGSDIKRWRKMRGDLSQERLSSMTGIAHGTIGRIESTNADVVKVDDYKALQKFFINEIRAEQNNFEFLYDADIVIEIKENAQSPIIEQETDEEMIAREHYENLKKINTYLEKENEELKRQVEELLGVKAKRSAS